MAWTRPQFSGRARIEQSHSLTLLALFGLPMILWAAAAPIIYPFRLCPGGGTPACYCCNGNPSPGSVGTPPTNTAGCTNGNPPGWSFGLCDQTTLSGFDCTQQSMGCGDNLFCSTPATKVGVCGGSNVVCHN